ncbi:MAG: serine/threonine-protein kinase [Myxococcota bacterium]
MDRLGSYVLRKRLAVGGMGEVYLGEKIGPEGFVKPVVLKCVLPQLASDRAFVKLFEDEARLSARLNHANIAQVYDFGLEDNTYYIAMEYVPGYTVDEIRRKLRSIGQFLPLQHVACIASQVCQGLYYAHTLKDGAGVPLGLVHRDVSPHNLIVSVDGGVKIVDFGIAKARAGLTRVQAKGAVGKFGYMSPEQARGEQVDGRSDVFSLGICLWELITNERLHDPNLDRAPDYSPARPVRSVEQFRTDMSRQFLEIMETALSIPREDRFQTAQQMHLALERFQAAMTHYAGQAALAQYIQDLVEGRIENPEQKPTGELVQAVDPVRRPVTVNRVTRESMDEAQKYEEVFGVTVSSKRPRPTLRAVPKSWDVQPPPAAGSASSPILLGSDESAPSAAPYAAPYAAQQPQQRPEQRPGQGRILDLGGNEPALETVPDLDFSRRPPSTVRPMPRPRPRKPSKGAPVGLIFVIVLLVGLGGAAYAFKDQLLPLVSRILATNTSESGRRMNSSYRILSSPPGGKVYLDGQVQPGTTPMTVDLIPEVEYQVQVRRKGWATAQQIVAADVHEGPAKVQFRLEKAGSLKITTIPPGATVTVDGRDADGRVTPLTLTDVPADRPLRVRMYVKGLPPQERTVTVPRGKVRVLNVEF